MCSCPEKVRGQSGLGAKEKEYRWDGHVAGAARIAVVPPGAADAVGPLQDHEVGDPLAAQPHGGPQPAEPGPDHRHPYMLVLGHPDASPPYVRDSASESLAQLGG